jgi:hypothetical protein
MISNMKIEFYPLWINNNPELFEKSKKDFFAKAKESSLNTIKEYWSNGLFYIEAVKIITND